MVILLTIVHVLICVFLIIVVLLQSGKAADIAGAFGGMGSQTTFGPRGSATVLSKATTIAAVLFMVTSLGLSILATRGAGSGGTVLERAPVSAPAQPNTPTKAAPAAPPIGVTPQGGNTVQIPLEGAKQQQQQQQQQQAPAQKK
ncbi:MAG: preprotein translocase subunit SecG [Bryobacteraceae bacterium]|nr:preprotein translocase subunit SecG [Bryobacteraceae bacterium]